MAKEILDVEQIMLNKDMDNLTSKLQKRLLMKRHMKCLSCGGLGTFQPIRLPSNMDKLQVYLSLEGIVACHEIKCHHCNNVEVVTSSDLPHREVNKRLKLDEVETEFFSAKVEHHEIIHDLLELLHIAAISDPVKRKQRHAELTSFVMKRVKTICEEWCRPENRDLRYKKFLMMYHETVIKSDDKPDLSPVFSEEYREIYQMLRSSFYSNKTHVELLLCLMKETLFDCPSKPGFMMWVKVAMMHTDQLEEFESRHYKYANMNIKSYDHLLDTFMALEIPLGLKKIPVVFMLFELPRFYHYIELYNRRCGSSTKCCILLEDEYRTIRELEVHMKMLKEKESGSKVKEPTKDKFRKILKNHSRQITEDAKHASKIKASISTGSKKDNNTDPPKATPKTHSDLSTSKTRSDSHKTPLNPSRTLSDSSKTRPDSAKTQSDLSKTRPESPKSQSDPPKTQSDLPKTQSDPSKTQSDPPKTQSDPPKTQSDLPKTQSDLPKTQSDPPKTQSDPPKTQSDPPKTQSDPPKTQSDPPKTQSDPPKTQSDPPKTQSDPPKTQSDPPKTQSDPPKTQSDPPKTQSDPIKFTAHSGKLKDLDITIQSSSFVPPQSSTYIKEPLTDGSEESTDSNKDKELSKCINSSKVKEIDPENGTLKEYDQVTFNFTDNDGVERETILMQTEPTLSKIIGYNKDTFRIADLSTYELEPIFDDAPKKSFTPSSFTIEIGKGKKSPAVTKVEELPSDVLAKMRPLESSNEDSLQKDEKHSPEIEEDMSSETPSSAESQQPISTDEEDNKVTSDTTEVKDQAEADKSNDAAIIPFKSLNKTKSKRPHHKYGSKWRKNKSTYNVDEVSDTDSDKEEEYTFYPCKLLSEYVESQNIVETACKDIPSSGVLTLCDFLDSHNIHHSLWSIKKKYIQNELFVILDMARDSDGERLPLVSASNNRGISVPVLPILNLSSDSSALDQTIGSLYGIQVSHKLSKKQKNVFQRYIRIAVARARHPELFDKVSLGAIKYVKTNDKRVEVKLSVKDMQYEAKNEEESERRKIIRLLRRAGAEQDVKKKVSKAKQESTSDGVPDPLQTTAVVESIKYRPPDVYNEPPAEKKITLKIDKHGKIKGNKPEKKLQKASRNALQFGKNDLMSNKQFKSSLTAARNLGCDISVEYVIERDDGSTCSATNTTVTHHRKDSDQKKKREIINKVKSKPQPKDEESVTTQLPTPPPPPSSSEKQSTSTTDTTTTSTSAATKEVKQQPAKVTFRDKFSSCSYCNQSISDHIRICSGCRKVCYCDSKCQKSHWKVHKKMCFYALSKDMKSTTG